MRSPIRTAFFAPLLTVGLLACTSLLGDFQVVEPSAGDAGSGDSSAALFDAANDGNVDDRSDSADGAPGSAPLHCQEIANTTKKIADLTESEGSAGGGSPEQLWARVYTPNADGTRAVIVVQSPDGIVHGFDFSADGSSLGLRTVEVQPGGQLLAVRRYATGMLALVANYRSASGAPDLTLNLMRLEDGANAWSPLQKVTPDFALDNQGSDCVTSLAATMEADAATGQDVLIAFSYLSTPVTSGACGAANNPHLGGVHVTNGSAGPIQTYMLPQNASRLDLLEDALYVSNDAIYLMLSASNGQPAAGSPTTLIGIDPHTYAYQAQMTLNPSSAKSFLLPAGLKLAPSGTDALVALLEASLDDSTVKPTFYVGAVAPSALPTLTPPQLANTSFAGISDLPIDKARSHWESYAAPASSNFLSIGRVYPNAKGFNLVWWDGQGNVRGRRTDTDAEGALLKTVTTPIGGTATFLNPPNLILATVLVAWTQTNAGGGYELWTEQVACTK